MVNEKNVQQVMRNIMIMVACKLGKASVTWSEVEAVYASGEYPEINADIDYIIEGKGGESACQSKMS